MQAIKQFFPLVPFFIFFYLIFLMKAIEHLFITLYKMVLYFESVDEILKGDYSNRE